MSEDSLGRFVWYDLMSTDPEASQRFYTQLIGWGTEIWDGGDDPYTMWTAHGSPLGGVMPLPKEATEAGAPPHWLAYVSTPDVDATAEKAGELGASIVVPATDIPGVGRFAVLADPQGAVFAVFKPQDPAPAGDEPPGLQQFSWHELMTSDYEAALAFYSELFGWQRQETVDMGDAGTYQMYGRAEGPPLGGMFNKPPEVPVNAWLFYVSVPDIDAAAVKVRELGGQIVHGSMEVPGGDQVLSGIDPQGAMFALHAPQAP